MPTSSDIMFGFCRIACAPLRCEASSLSSMTSQLLFFELVEILKEQNDWYYVRSLRDSYEGWADRRVFEVISEKEKDSYLSAMKENPLLVKAPFSYAKTDKGYLPLSIGAMVPGLKIETAGNWYMLDGNDIVKPMPYAAGNVRTLTKGFMNVPYLWGGKSFLGMDCSGFVQIVFSFLGVELPRDSKDQAQKGEEVALQNSHAGDLAFFSNDAGKITHVGILLSGEEIVHCSAFVRQDRITDEGIIDSETGLVSHRLAFVKRIFEE